MTNEEPEELEVGDLVMHRISHEQAIVIDVCFPFKSNRPGFYEVSNGFAGSFIVHISAIEKVQP